MLQHRVMVRFNSSIQTPSEAAPAWCLCPDARQDDSTGPQGSITMLLAWPARACRVPPGWPPPLQYQPDAEQPQQRLQCHAGDRQ